MGAPNHLGTPNGRDSRLFRRRGRAEGARVALLLEHYSRLEDDREPWRIVYPLSEVLLLLTCATIASRDDFDEIAETPISRWRKSACWRKPTITAIPVLLDHLAERKQLEGALVTSDAMGCQVEIAAKIVEHKADFLLPLKGNQPTLEAEVEAYFETAPAEELVYKTTVEKGHGRIETGVITASKVVDWIESEKS